MGFYNQTDFRGDLSKWDTSRVKSMESMFYDAASFIGDGISNWDVSHVTNMDSMFYKSLAFNQPIGSWDTSKVTDMYAMFESVASFNQDITNWDVSQVTSMERMFYECSSFDQDVLCVDRCRVHDGANRHVLRGDFVSNEIRVRERERRPGEYVHVAGTDSRCKLARVRRRVFSDCADGWFVHFVGQIRARRFMPNWDVSLVTDMSGWTEKVYMKALAVKVHSTLIFRSGTPGE